MLPRAVHVQGMRTCKAVHLSTLLQLVCGLQTCRVLNIAECRSESEPLLASPEL